MAIIIILGILEVIIIITAPIIIITTTITVMHITVVEEIPGLMVLEMHTEATLEDAPLYPQIEEEIILAAKQYVEEIAVLFQEEILE